MTIEHLFAKINIYLLSNKEQTLGCEWLKVLSYLCSIVILNTSQLGLRFNFKNNNSNTNLLSIIIIYQNKM